MSDRLPVRSPEIPSRPLTSTSTAGVFSIPGQTFRRGKAGVNHPGQNGGRPSREEVDPHETEKTGIDPRPNPPVGRRPPETYPELADHPIRPDP
jgi:hypothetical protein